MSDGASPEVLIDRAVPLADVASGAGEAPAGAGKTKLAAELRASRDWRRTTLGAGGDLSGVDLSGEDLRGVDFTGAPLNGAKLTNAALADADFRWASLNHADFSGATGLVGSQFSRASLTGARVPDTVRFGAFETANEIAESTGKLFLTLLLVCAYSWLTINSTLDAKLLTDTGASQLPILNTQIPIVNFYALVPLGLVGLALITMLQGQRLWAAVAAAPAALPDGTTMADRAAGWVLGPWAAERVMPAANRGFLTRLQARLGAFVGWWLVPLTLAWFWARYLHRHDWTVTTIQLVALAATACAAAAFQQLAHATLPEQYEPPPPGRAAQPAWRRELHHFTPTIAIGLGVSVVFGLMSYAGIRGIHQSADAELVGKRTGQERASLTLERTSTSLQAILPKLMVSVGIRPVAELEEAQVSTPLTSGTVVDTGPDPKATGARLINADLRFASAKHVFLAAGDLSSADLFGANLTGADLRRADLTGASLAGVLLREGDLRKVQANAAPVATRMSKLGGVTTYDTLYCSRASFAGAYLRYARFNGADLREASFDETQLQGATFPRARLTHATFVGADLDGADFRGAIGLTAEQVLAAQHTDALYDSTLLADLKARSPGRFATYDRDAIAAQTELAQLSGAEDADTLTADERKARWRLLRAAYQYGAAPLFTQDSPEISAWLAEKQSTSGSVPYGCLMVRVQRPPRAG